MKNGFRSFVRGGVVVWCGGAVVVGCSRTNIKHTALALGADTLTESSKFFWFFQMPMNCGRTFADGWHSTNHIQPQSAAAVQRAL